MMEWQPIETAPKDTSVELGRYIMTNNGPLWVSDVGPAWVSVKFLFWNVRLDRHWRADGATHWRSLPEPPK